MNPRRRWVWVGYWAGVSLLALVLLGVSGQVLGLERAETRSRAETARQEASRLALWRMDSWLAPVLAREARRPYFEYRAVLPAGRAYEHMWDPIATGEPIVPSALIVGVPEEDQPTGPEGERLIRLHLQIEPDGRVTSPQHPTDSELVNLVTADPLVAASSAGRDRAGVLLESLTPMLEPRLALGQSRPDLLNAPSPVGGLALDEQDEPTVGNLEGFTEDLVRSADQPYVQGDKFSIGEYAARSQVAQLAQSAEGPEQQIYTNSPGNRLDENARQARGPTETETRAAKDVAFTPDTSAPAAVPIASAANERPDDRPEGEREAGATNETITSKSLADNAGVEVSESAANGALRKVEAERVREKDGEVDAVNFDAKSVGGFGRTAMPAEPLDAYDYADLGDQAGFTAGVPAPAIRVGAFRPRWLRSPNGEPELLYLREVTIEGRAYQQGVWFDWDALRGALLASSPDLPRGSTIEPVSDGLDTPGLSLAELNPQQQLATVPAVLRLPPMVRPPLGMTPARWSLVLTWAAVLASVGAIGIVLRTAMRLSDRRVRFVGAVTHELRTPLTTFRLYSQMLADGMVTEESARKDYLVTLKQESARLAGIVENVLAYARLNRAGKDQQRVRTEAITPEALLVRLRPGLSRRAEQSGMDLIVSNEVGADSVRGADGKPRELLVDPQSVERVLTNLVDNACKYAAPSGEDDPDAETRIHLDVKVAGDNLEFLVSDYGPGIDPSDRGKIFGEFQRGRAGQRADRSGLGLGLALSRGLARESGGDLRLVRRRGHGAEFLLTLPMKPTG